MDSLVSMISALIVKEHTEPPSSSSPRGMNGIVVTFYPTRPRH